MRIFFTYAMAALLLAGCTAGPGKKPGTMTWKVNKDETPLSYAPATWTKGSLNYELSGVTYIKSYTLIKVQSYRLQFSFKVTNSGSSEADVFGGMPKGSLTLQDGSVIDRLVWTARTVKLAPGASTTGMYFSDNSLNEGARPKRLAMDGKEVARW